MISAELMGRLGNQMFIVAATLSLARDNQDEAMFSDLISGITPSQKSQSLYKQTIFRKINFTHPSSLSGKFESIHVEPQNHRYKEIEYNKNLFLKGYFQCEKYFCHNREFILDLFSPLEEVNNFIHKKYRDIINNDECVFVHIRRGDFLKYKEYHNNLGKEYYDKAFSEFKGHKLVFFSDDIEWCRQTFGEKDENYFVDAQNDIIELYLMSKIKNGILSNSSFSWWGSWLNKDPGNFVAPHQDRWFGVKNSHLNAVDIIPNRWKKI
tara:strand:+ start:2725 stop:3522 length:798 start_codon:yes stop_codon:yes gene_type:complete